jgi:GTP-binding protein HflX
LLALNKIDLLPSEERQRVAGRFPGSVGISAVTGEGVDELLDEIGLRLEQLAVEVEAVIPYTAGTLLGKLHDAGRVLSSSHEENGVRVRVKARAADLHALEPYLDGASTPGGTAQK